MTLLKKLAVAAWDMPFLSTLQEEAITFLENGSVLYYPDLSFFLEPHELKFLTPQNVDPSRKNITYDFRKETVGGSLWKGNDAEKLRIFLKRYSECAASFVKRLFPHYESSLRLGKTTLRPVEIKGRKSSVHKDDTRLHVDAFPSSPTKGERILRFFTNINQEGKSRVWRVGEPFENVVKKYSCAVAKPFPGSHTLLKLLKVTKQKRTLYDHYMLHMHNKMKEDDHYQENVRQEEIHFPPSSSWMVFTDQVSHAAMAGQHVLEQTFYLPANALHSPATAPVKILERHLGVSTLL